MPKTKNVQAVIDCAYDILQKNGVKPCQEHWFVETGASLKWSYAMVDKPLLDGGHKVRKRRTLHGPASSDDDGVRDVQASGFAAEPDPLREGQGLAQEVCQIHWQPDERERSCEASAGAPQECRYGCDGAL